MRKEPILPALRRFMDDERGTASMEFVVTLPLLLGPLIIAAEYGQALSDREAFDSAVADATALLAVAPALPGPTFDDPPLINRYFYDRARRLILERLNVPEEAVLFHAEFTRNITGDADSDDDGERAFYLVEVQAAVLLDLSLLSFFNGFFVGAEGAFRESLPIVSYDAARYVAAVPPIDNVPCDFDDLVPCNAAINAVKLGATDRDEIEATFGAPPFPDWETLTGSGAVVSAGG